MKTFEEWIDQEVQVRPSVRRADVRTQRPSDIHRASSQLDAARRQLAMASQNAERTPVATHTPSWKKYMKKT